MQPQGPVLYVTQSVPVPKRYDVNHNLIRVTAFLQLAAGIISFLLDIIYLALAAITTNRITERSDSSYIYDVFIFLWGGIGTGFWCGIPFIIAGGLGIAAGNGHDQSRCCCCSMVTGYLVMSIISAILATLCLLVWGAAIGVMNYMFPEIPGLATIMVLSLLVAIMEMAAAIAGSVFCCKGMGSTTTGTVPATTMQYVPPGTYPTKQQPHP